MGARWVGNSKFSTCLLEIHAYFDIFWELRCFVLCDTQVVTLIVSWEEDLQKKKIQRETVPLLSSKLNKVRKNKPTIQTDTLLDLKCDNSFDDNEMYT